MTAFQEIVASRVRKEKAKYNHWKRSDASKAKMLENYKEKLASRMMEIEAWNEALFIKTKHRRSTRYKNPREDEVVCVCKKLIAYIEGLPLAVEPH